MSTHIPKAGELTRTWYVIDAKDQVLGKLYADWTFERASDALRRYQTRDRIRGLSYTVKQLRDRGQIGGVELSPAVVRGLLGVTVPTQVCTAQGDYTLPAPDCYELASDEIAQRIERFARELLAFSVQLRPLRRAAS